MKILFFDSTPSRQKDLISIFSYINNDLILDIYDNINHERYDLILIHTSNINDENYIENNIKKKLDETLHIIHGGYSLDEIIFENNKIGTLKYKTLKNNFESFLNKISSKNNRIEKEDLYTLFGFNPVLEDSIKLWKSLTLEGIKLNHEDIEREQITKQLDSLNDEYQESQISEKAKRILKKLASNKKTDPEELQKNFQTHMKNMYTELFPASTK